MSVKLEDYHAEKTLSRIKEVGAQHQTPFVVVDLETISDAYDRLQRCFPYAHVYYAVKANPAPEITQLLLRKDSNFDIASVYELDKVLALGVPPHKLSFGNTIKKAADVRYAFQRGVRLFVTDSESDLVNIAKEAPGSRVFVRILTEGSGQADWPLSRKFGCSLDMAFELLVLAKELGLQPYGLSFHVGSQQRSIASWDSAIANVKYLFHRLLEEKGIKLKMVNLGGGFPAHYVNGKTDELETYASEITRFLKEDFGEDFPEVILEPGRSLIANAGILFSEVVLVSRKSAQAEERWVYCDVGKFGGLVETMDESIKFPVWTEKAGETEEVILAGPTCDSADIMYEHYRYQLPLSLASGDRLLWLSTGAYTVSYSSVEFNGFPPLRSFYVPLPSTALT